VRHEITLSAGAIILAPIGVEHVTDQYVSWLNDPTVTAQTEIRHSVSNLAGTQAYVRRTLDAADAAMWRILDGALHIGNIRLSAINRQHRRAAMAILIGDRDRQGRGIGTTAISLLSQHALSAMGLNKLSAGIYATNPASRRAFEKARYGLEATLQRHAFVDGRFIDVWQLARFAGEK
jgi:ribosomal-protein-alanine N-acetyltransferase